MSPLNRSMITDWNMKGLDFKGGSSELSMLVGSSSIKNSNNMADGDVPKLEDFLGGNSFADHDHQKISSGLPGNYDSSSGAYLFSNSFLQVTDTAMVTTSNGGLMSGTNGGTNTSTIGLSMIKTWLRNHPAPSQQPENNKGNIDVGDCGGGATVGNINGGSANSQSLSLSMSMGSQSSSALPLVTVGASGGGESSSSEGKQKASGGGLDAQTGAIETAPRKSIDTFGQRTSIYRGVTRCVNLHLQKTISSS